MSGATGSAAPLWRAAFVRRLPREGKLSVSLETLEAGATSTTLLGNLLRDPSEEVSRTLARLGKTLAKHHRRKRPAPCCEVELHDSSKIDGGLTAQRALTDLGAAILVNGSERFPIRVHHPRVHEVNVRGFAIEGCPIAPWIQGDDLADATLHWTWAYADAESSTNDAANASDTSKSDDNKDPTPPAPPSVDNGIASASANVIARSRVYTPTKADRGRKLRVTCTADGDFPVPATCDIDGLVLESPPWDAMRDRVQAQPQGTVRVLSYNVLADTYSHTWDEMYPYCDPAHRDIRYRAPLLAREVGLCDPDVICMQEVDAKMVDFWSALLEPEFVCHYTPKDGSGMEGCFFAARKTRYRVAHFEAVSFRDLVKRRRDDALWLNHLLQSIESLEHSISRVTSIAQLAVLEPVSGTSVAKVREDVPLIVTNTHSFFHPGAGNIRCIQAKLLADLVQEKRRARGRKDAVIMCGDWNAQSYDLSLQFLLHGTIGADHPEWATSSIFQFESKANLARDVIFEDAGKDSQRYMDILSQTTGSGRARPISDLRKQVEAVDDGYSLVDKLNVVAELKNGLAWHEDAADRVAIGDMIAQMQSHLVASRTQLIAAQRARTEAHGDVASGQDHAVGCGARLSHSLNLFSAYGKPEFTNFVGNWQGDLDWILCSRELVAVAQTAPIPSKATLQVDTALPSRTFPSDHVSLCADLRVKGPGGQEAGQ
ncbi:Glucose-repressible alcohol dehydrogenase transcriptional effector [Hondaea fermentalgiana]|uniref:Glucose-repressible alcohol dehydrogenase transcriptional effector n=1 Tax=Hondaea fermentalgiana TaxID=2315210 RepID=A0A2R5GIB2_9STRA|nr:Glucose-repressible alcohol dehydrogenase transcriptional effector [Hondaea fermentalgiana]|eukprot:GBG30627.1 Glucose-repressible alcohol dehydrogenase transcriptional effector [Hondaea fermentalgiana]